MKTTRRKFVKVAGVAGAGFAAGGFINLKAPVNEIKILNPVDGDMLCAYDGKMSDEALLTTITASAPAGSKIKINLAYFP